MKSKPKPHLSWRRCTTCNKIPFPSKAQAKRRMKLFPNKKGVHMEVYKGPCGNYHLTRKRN